MGDSDATNDNIIAGIQALLDKNENDAQRVIRILYDENYRLREQKREMQGRIPNEGATVLTADQSPLWESYQRLGAPAELETRLARLQEVESQLSGLQKEAVISQATEILGVVPKVFRDLVRASGFEVVVTDGKVSLGGKSYDSLVGEGGEWAVYSTVLKTNRAMYPSQQSGTGVSRANDPVEAFIKRTGEAAAAARNPLAS